MKKNQVANFSDDHHGACDPDSGFFRVVLGSGPAALDPSHDPGYFSALDRGRCDLETLPGLLDDPVIWIWIWSGLAVVCAVLSLPAGHYRGSERR